MENQNVKKGRGRPRKLTDEERKNNKTKYMLNKEWYCDICKTGRNCTLAGKSCHLNTQLHAKNIINCKIADGTFKPMVPLATVELITGMLKESARRLK